MFKSVADRLGFPHSSHSSSSISSQNSSSTSTSVSSSPSSHHHNQRSNIFSSTSSTRSPSRQQQQQQQQQHRAHNGTSKYNTTTSNSTYPRTVKSPSPPPPPPQQRKLSNSTPKPVLPPLSFHRNRDSNLAQSVAKAAGVSINTMSLNKPSPKPMTMTTEYFSEQDTSSSQQPSRAAENITVTVRVRPFSVAELRGNHGGSGPTAEVWAVLEDDSRIRYADEYSMRERRAAVDYAYDHALTGSDNERVYTASVKSLVQSAMEGYNGTVFAYGQTSSGKTYTMSGTGRQPGITPRAIEDVFKYIRENSEREFLLRVSYLEIYNESIRDLLSPEAIDLRIHEDRKRGVYVSPLKEEIVTTPSQVMRILQRGDNQRHTSSTDYNARSSRSHSIFQIVIESRERAPTAPRSPEGRKPSLGLGPKSSKAVRVSQLNLIDLAGSEKASSDVERRKEGAFINKSLLTLGTVISKLTEEKGAHIPYRDSKLTRILQSSLSGNARVSVICTISPSFSNVEESHNTLKFAARVKKVVTKAHTNQVMDDKALLEKYRREIGELKSQLLLTTAIAAEREQSDGAGGFGEFMSIDKGQHAELSHLLERERLKHEEEMVEMNMVRNALKERIDHLTKLILTSQSINNTTAAPGVGSSFLTSPLSAGGRPSSMHSPSIMGRYTVETTADGTVLEFPKEIESRLARKDTMVRQLQSELETQQEKVSLMKMALQRAAKGEAVDLEKTLAKVEVEPPREKFLIEKRASIMNLNGGMLWQDGALLNGHSRTPSKRHSRIAPDGTTGSGSQRNQGAVTGNDQGEPVSEVLKDDGASILSPDGERLAIDDEEEDEELLMDTPWNRSELLSLRQAKRELEIVVIEQEKKLEDMVAFEDSEEFQNLVIEMEEQREKILVMEEEREGFKATITDLKNMIRKLELSRVDGAGAGGIPLLPSYETISVLPSSSSTTSLSSTVADPSRAQELEIMLQRERKLRMEEQTRNMSRVASLEAEVTILKAEQSVRDLQVE